MTNSSLSKGWRFVKFGDVVDNMNETTRDPEAIGLDRVVGLDHMDPESLPLKRWDNLADLHEGTSFTRVFRSGQVLFGKRRAYQRKVSLPDFDGICSGDILVFQPKNTELLPEFLPYLVQSDGFFDHALGTSAGSLSPRTKWQELAKYEFALPPIAEQLRTVTVMKSLDKAIQAFRDVPLNSFEESLLSTFLGRGEKVGKTQLLGDLLQPIERGVEVKDLDQVDFAGVRWYAEGVYRRPSVSADDVKTRKLNRIAEGDVTYNRMWATKAAFGVVGADVDGCLVTNDFPTFISRDGIDPVFFSLLFKTRAFQLAASALAKGSTERRRLNENDFLSIKVIVPEGHDLESLIEGMKRLEILRTRINRNLEQLVNLGKGFLQSSWGEE